MSFKEKVDKFMIENNIDNVKQLAIKANIPYTTLRDFYEKKSVDNSRLSTVRKLAEYMKCTIDYLAYDDVESNNEIKVNGYDLSNKNEVDSSLQAKMTIKETPEKIGELIKFLSENKIDYEILSKETNKNND